MGFRFRLQPALDHASACETAARSAVIGARTRYDDVVRSRAAIDAAIAEHRAFRIALVRTGAPGFAATEAAIVALEVLGRRTDRELAERSTDLVRTRRAHADAARRRGALERVRDRRRDEYDMELELREADALDEANAMRCRAVPGDEAPPSASPKRPGVITLHRANGQPLIVNADLIETVERTGDGATAITLTTGNVLVVAELPDAVRLAAVAFRRSIALPNP